MAQWDVCVELVVQECVWCAVRVFCGRSLCCVFALFICVCGCIGSALEVLARQVVALLLLSLRVADASSSSSVLLVALVYFAVLHCSVWRFWVACSYPPHHLLRCANVARLAVPFFQRIQLTPSSPGHFLPSL